jgi:transcriptional regulator with XRE-family HTH domain
MISKYPHWMQNGIKLFRERAGLSKAELARRIGTSRAQLGRLEDGEREFTKVWAEKIAKVLGCSAQELLFPEMARLDPSRFRNVFEVLADEDAAPTATNPVLALEGDFLARLLPSAANHRLQLMTVDSDPGGNLVQKGDTVLVDLDDTRPARPGIYAIILDGVPQLRHLSPTTAGMVRIGAGSDTETVSPDEIQVLGRARLRLSTI